MVRGSRSYGYGRSGLPREVLLAVFACGLLIGLMFQAKYRRLDRDYIQSLEQRVRMLEGSTYPTGQIEPEIAPRLDPPGNQSEESHSREVPRVEDPRGRQESLLLCWVERR